MINLNHSEGNKQSLDVTKALENCNDLNVFKTKFAKRIIEYKWSQVSDQAFVILMFQFLLTFFITAHIYNPGKRIYLYIMLAYALYLVFFEAIIFY
jgi:hypothetical protein